MLPDAATCLGQLLRLELMPVLGTGLVETQWGSGFDGGGCSSPQRLLTRTMAVARRMKVSAAALFVDPKAAYSSMIRKIVLVLILSTNLMKTSQSSSTPVVLVWTTLQM